MNDKKLILQIVQQAVKNSNEVNVRNITCRLILAQNYREIGFWDTNSQSPLPQIEINFFEGNKIQKFYEALLNTSERFNRLEVNIDKQKTSNAMFTWDQAYYDTDIESNKRLRKNN